MFDFNALLVFLKSLFGALVELVKKLGLKIGEEEAADETDE